LQCEPIQVNHTSTISPPLLNHIAPKPIKPVQPIQKPSILQVQLIEKDKLIASLQNKLQQQFDVQKEKNSEIEQLQERLAIQEQECRQLQRIILEKFNNQAPKEEYTAEQNGQVHVQIKEVNRLKNELEKLNSQKLCIVCIQHQRDCILQPCTHFCICTECAFNIVKGNDKKCPKCRSPVATVSVCTF